VRSGEQGLEARVSEYIRELSYLWLQVAGDPGPGSLRAHLERNSITLLSNWRKPALDPMSASWLGNWSRNDKVVGSDLWNSNHVDETYEPSFLATLEEYVCRMPR
jgi:hypothetical protein